jgi:amino acid transporter
MYADSIPGTGLFVGSGQALAIGGPGFLFAAYCLMSLCVYGVVTAVIEIGTHLPVSGSSMSYYCTRYVSSSVGFALGWLYFYSFGIIVAYEITAASIVINYWPNNVNIAVWITIMLIVIVALNFSPVGVYAETEFWFASIKIIMITGLLVLSVVLFFGGGPSHDRLGFRYWNHPGATKPYLVPGAGGRFTSFLYVWVFAGFSFYFGPELIIFTAGEMRSPRKNLPTASRRFFGRLVFFYVLSTLAIGAICSSTAKGLTTGSGYVFGCI